MQWLCCEILEEEEAAYHPRGPRCSYHHPPSAHLYTYTNMQAGWSTKQYQHLPTKFSKLCKQHLPEIIYMPCGYSADIKGSQQDKIIDIHFYKYVKAIFINIFIQFFFTYTLQYCGIRKKAILYTKHEYKSNIHQTP